MAQAFAALEAVYAKAVPANGGKWPTKEQVAKAMPGLKFQAFGRPVEIRADGQGIEDQLIGTTRRVPAYPFAILDKMTIFPASQLMPAVGQKSDAWIKTLTPAIMDVKVDNFSFDK
jgi:branched-chain amino acid transport system substrate-binding protein